MCHSPQLQAAYYVDCDCYLFDPFFQPLKDYLSRADISLANLETTLPGERSLYLGYPRFGSPDALLKALQRLGIDILTLANNHALDNGARGLKRTIRVIRELGLHSLGSYPSREARQQNRLLIVERKGIRLALLNYTYGTNGMPIPQDVWVNLIDKREIAEDMHRAYQAAVDGTVVLFHFGTEYRRYPDRYQREIVSFTLQQGADIVLGSHPHVLQPYSIKKRTDIYGRNRQRLVAYSLGNFISNQRGRYTSGGIIFNIVLSKNILSKNPDPLQRQQLRFHDVNYLPVWVYVREADDGKQFFVLPIADYLKNDRQPRLPAKDFKKMLRFYKDTRRHLGNH